MNYVWQKVAETVELESYMNSICGISFVYPLENDEKEQRIRKGLLLPKSMN